MELPVHVSLEEDKYQQFTKNLKKNKNKKQAEVLNVHAGAKETQLRRLVLMGKLRFPLCSPQILWQSC